MISKMMTVLSALRLTLPQTWVSCSADTICREGSRLLQGIDANFVAWLWATGQVAAAWQLLNLEQLL